MDMRRHLHKWLNNDTLREMGDHYEGRIRDVVEEKLNNRFKGKKALEPVITFEDGWRLCPNISQRRALVELWGPDTEEWLGRRLTVYRQRIERPGADGLTRITYEKRVALPAPVPLKQAQ